jgi:hypothetical protein
MSARPFLVLTLTLAASACTSVTPTIPRPSLQRDPGLCACTDAGALPDATRPSDDAAMSLREPFAIEPAAPRITVHAAERAFLAVRLDRAPAHRAYVELKASGLPSGVHAIAAIGPSASDLGLVIEAADTARPDTDVPFTVEAHADGVRVSRRVLLTVLPERPTPEE